MTSQTQTDQLAEQFSRHLQEEESKFDQLIESQRLNTEAIAKLTASVARLSEDTAAIIELHRDFQGTIRLGKGVQSFLIWLLKWGVIGTGLVAIIEWLSGHFGK